MPTTIDAALAARFARLAARYERETAYAATMSARETHPAYQELLTLGPAVVPLILKRLEAGGSVEWFCALEDLSGSNPVPAEHAGRVRLMRDDWLAWGRAHGFAA